MINLKKAFSVGMSAALLASLFTIAAASSVLAAPGTTAVVSAGSVPRAGTSAGTTSFTFAEDAIDDWNGVGTLTVTILDSASANTLTFTGTPVLVAPDSLGATVAVSGNTFTVTTTDWDPLNVEQFSVTGLTIKAAAGAALGAIKTTYAGTGVFFLAFESTPKATGTLAGLIGPGATSAIVNVTSACPFAVTAGGDLNAVFTSPSDSKAISAVTGLVGGQQTLTVAATTAGHAAGTAVSQVLAACVAGAGVLASAGTVVDSLKLTVENGPYGVQPGLFNQDIGTIALAERGPDPYMAVGTVVTMTITTAGVVWSHSLDANTHDFAGTEFELAAEASTLSADRKTVTWTVLTASTAGSYGYMHENGPWEVDVAASAVLGSTVDVTVTASGLLVTPTSVTIGYINNVIAGTAATPIVYIGENDQSTGMVTLNEAAIGSFTAGGTTNVFSVTLGSNEYFTRAPFAVVTASNLKLRNPSTLLGATSLVGVLSNSNHTATWTIYSASTDVPASIDIRGSGADGTVLAAGSLNGVRINVVPGAPIGTVNLNVASGTATNQTDFAILPIAVRAFRSGVIVTALSQPTIPKGSADSLGGDITITETLTGQFRSGQDICVSILPRSTNFFIQDTFLKTANTNDRPVITATPGSGLVVGPVSIGCVDENPATNTTNSFEFSILQQAFSPNLGKITVSNIHYITVADAPTGAVLVSVYGDTGGGATNFQTIVSNATIGTPVPFAFNVTGTALGNTLTGPFTPATKISTGGYITWRFDGGAAAAGKTIQIWAYKKVGLFTNPWSAPYLLTTRVANASGVAFANITSGSVIWLSIRPVLPATATTPAIWGPWSIGRWIH